jgi:hypothetical protein
MTATILLAGALMTAILGAGFIALSNRANWMAAAGSPLPSHLKRRNAALGGALLLSSSALAILRDGFGLGLLLGPLLIATGIATIIAILAVRPRILLVLCELTLVGGANLPR